MSPFAPLRVVVDPDGRRLVDVEDFVTAVEREIDQTEAEMSALPARYAHDPDLRDRLADGLADAIAAGRERLAQHADALRRTGKRAP